MKLSDFSLPGEWRAGQWDIVMDILSAMQEKKYVLACIPTGGGKSYIAWAVSHILRDAGTVRGRTDIVTATKGLQRQYEDTFGKLGMAVVMGKNNYPCYNKKQLTCEEAWPFCGKDDDYPCCYRDAVMDAVGSDHTVMNYHYRANAERVGESTGLLIADEAHEANEVICDSMAAGTNERELDMLKIPWPKVEGWEAAKYIRQAAMQAEAALANETSVEGARKRSAAERLGRAFDRVQRDWIVSYRDGRVGREISFDPVWAGVYTKSALVQGAERVLLMSATVRAKTRGLLGIKQEDSEFLEYGPMFDKRRHPITWVKSVRLRDGMADSGYKVWVYTIDNILRPRLRLGRKAVVHTFSYQRARIFMELSEFKDRAVTHRDAGGTARAVEEFTANGDGADILVSPSVYTGYDFKDDMARVNIIGKVPFISSAEPVVKARCDQDKEYAMYITAQNLAQAAGRIMRSGDDWGETFVVDDNIGWFAQRYGYLLPKGLEIRQGNAGNVLKGY